MESYRPVSFMNVGVKILNERSTNLYKKITVHD